MHNATAFVTIFKLKVLNKIKKKKKLTIKSSFNEMFSHKMNSDPKQFFNIF